MAADLLHPSAGEASPDLWTSEAPCRLPASMKWTPGHLSKRLVLHSLRRWDELRKARTGGDVVGLVRRPRTDQGNFHRLDSIPCGSRRFWHARCFTRDASPCTLLPGAILAGPVKGRLSPQTISPDPETGNTEKDASHRLLQPTNNASTLQIAWFPCAPFGLTGWRFA